MTTTPQVIHKIICLPILALTADRLCKRLISRAEIHALYMVCIWLYKFICKIYNIILTTVVQSIVSLKMSLRRELVKYMTTIHVYANTPLFLLEKYENLLQCKSFSHFPTKNNSVFVIIMFKILARR